MKPDPALIDRAETPALEFRDVTVVALRDPALSVLEEVNWTVATGDYWAVAGLLRSGKSDLMALAAGITQPTEGSYRLFGRELAAGFEHEQLALRLRVGLVFDGGQLLHHLTLEENIALPLRYHGGLSVEEVDVRLRALLQFTALEAWAHRLPEAVNRSWQQRIGLARALALRPEVLLLDSPLTGLDPRDAAWWLETVDGLAAGHALLDGRPLTVVVTGDDLRPWLGHARRFGVLRNRRLLELGSREEAAAQPDIMSEATSPGSPRGAGR